MINTNNMIKLFFKAISNIGWIYRLAVKIIANRIVHEKERLTPEYLIQKGWIKDKEHKNFYYEPEVKERYKIWVEFDDHDFSFRVYYGRNKTFIALEKSLEWFNMFYLLAHADNGRNKLAGL